MSNGTNPQLQQEKITTQQKIADPSRRSYAPHTELGAERQEYGGVARLTGNC